MTRLISNSETNSWLTCRRLYHFEYFMDLEPKQESEPIAKGVLIHAALEEYYIAKSEGLSEDECREAARQPIMQAMMNDLLNVAEVGAIDNLIAGYFNHYTDDDDKYEVYAVEAKYSMELTPEYSLPGTIDLIWKDKSDGRFIVVDHKSSYNFFSEEKLTMLGQMPKYIAVLRNAGIDVKYGIINQLRTRPLKEGNELYRRAVVNPTRNKLTSVLAQHMAACEEIISYRNNPALELSVPLMNPMTCTNCKFFTLCDSTLEGAPIKYQVQQEFKARTSYGYNPITE